MTNKKTTNEVNPLAAGVVGAVAGAAIGMTAVALSDKKNRKNLESKFNEFKKDGQKAYTDLKSNVDQLSARADKSVTKVKKALGQ